MSDRISKPVDFTSDPSAKGANLGTGLVAAGAYEMEGPVGRGLDLERCHQAAGAKIIVG